LPRTHGSALFTRGPDAGARVGHAGHVADEQRIDSIDVAQETTKSFLLALQLPAVLDR